MNDRQERTVRQLLIDIRRQLDEGVSEPVSLLERADDVLSELLQPPAEESVEDDQTVQPCEDCGSPEATHIPCPYAQDLHGDETLHWLCEDCGHNRGMEL